MNNFIHPVLSTVRSTALRSQLIRQCIRSQHGINPTRHDVKFKHCNPSLSITGCSFDAITSQPIPAVKTAVVPLEHKSTAVCCKRMSTTTHSSTSQPDLQVYSGPLTRMVKTVKVFSITTSAICVAIQPLLISKTVPYGSILTAVIGGVIGLYAVLTPVVLHWVAKRYVTQLDFDPQSKTFTATTLSLFLRKKKLKFVAEDVVIPEVPGPLTSFVVKKKPLLIDPNYFTDHSAYAHLMGYDKPLDFELRPETMSNPTVKSDR